jgi:hypothetical protein
MADIENAPTHYRLTVQALDRAGEVHREWVLHAIAAHLLDGRIEAQERAHRMSSTRIIVESENGTPERRVIGPYAQRA